MSNEPQEDTSSETIPPEAEAGSANFRQQLAGVRNNVPLLIAIVQGLDQTFTDFFWYFGHDGTLLYW